MAKNIIGTIREGGVSPGKDYVWEYSHTENEVNYGRWVRINNDPKPLGPIGSKEVEEFIEFPAGSGNFIRKTW